MPSRSGLSKPLKYIVINEIEACSGRHLARKRICRTFSDCTTGPRGGLISGCFPLDEFYRGQPDAAQLREFKRRSEQDSQVRDPAGSDPSAE